MGCNQSKTLDTDPIIAANGKGKITKASRRDSVAVHKKHLAKKKK